LEIDQGDTPAPRSHPAPARAYPSPAFGVRVEQISSVDRLAFDPSLTSSLTPLKESLPPLTQDRHQPISSLA
jgi:hypothetical protein